MTAALRSVSLLVVTEYVSTGRMCQWCTCGEGKCPTGLREHPGVDGALGGRGVPQGLGNSKCKGELCSRGVVPDGREVPGVG